MFAIIISEKGGAERRESFDKNEINVGRVQGNDLMLPKGNVSKHHARLLFRDGRFIVTDLKSTNGTYVNGRKIAQATIVREGDKIYIGDFVLRLETNGAGAAPQPEATSNEEESIRTLARDQGGGPPPGPGPTGPRPGGPMPAPPAVTLKAPTHPPGAPLPRPQASNVSHVSQVPPQVVMPGGGSSGGNAFPAMDDNDDSSQMAKPRIPSAAPPAPTPIGGPMGGGMPGMGGPGGPGGSGTPLGGPVRPMTMPLNQMSPPIIGQRPSTAPPGGMAPLGPPPGAATALAPQPATADRSGAPPPMQAPPQPAGPPPLPPQPTLDRSSERTNDRPSAQQVPPPAQSSQSVPPARPTAPPPRQPPKETPAQAGRRLALMTLLDRIADAVDLSPLRQSPQLPDGLAQQIERAARDQANAMREEGDAPEGIDLDAVVRDAHRELVGLGAFGPLLEDEEVAEINCVRFDQLFTVRNNGITAEPAAFSSEEALQRVIARLAYQSGDPWKPGETVLERRLPRASFVAITPPAASGHVVSIRKRRRIESSLDDLTRAGAMSRPMAQFLEACVTARANVLVSGNGPLALLSALSATGNGGERVVVVQDVEEIAVAGHAHAVNLAIADTRRLGEECVRAAAKLRPDRLIVTQLAGGIAAATVDAMAEGADGVLAAVPAPTLRQGLARLVAQLVLHRPGLALEGMRDVVGEAFDVAVEIGMLPDGRLRVMRIAELGGSDAKGIVARDVFVFNADGSGPGGGDGSFSATGVVPRIANDLAARGMKLDAAMFKRAAR